MRGILILASASERRRELLKGLGLEFIASEAKVDETMPLDVAPEKGVVEVAWRKAQAALMRGEGAGVSTSDHVLAADTIVLVDGRILGKPLTTDAAARFLASLSGRTHTVVTGVVVRSPDGSRFDATEKTDVTFDPLSEAQIATYVATGEPLDKAGGYAIQGGAAAFVREVRGDYFNVVGLPLRRTIELLHATNYPLPSHLKPSSGLGP